MAVTKWAPGTLYPPGSLVQPLSAQTPAINQPENPGFETGTLEDWSYTTEGGSATAAVQSTYKYTGSHALYWPGGHGSGNEGGIGAFFVNDERVLCSPGTSITAQCFIMYNPTSSPNGSQGRCLIYWFNASDEQIGSPVQGALIRGRGNNGHWRVSVASGTAPAGTAYASIGAWLTTVTGGTFADEFSWNYVQQVQPGLMYRAVQAAAGYSSDAEPAWPPVSGEQVVDNEVIWEAVLLTRIVWEAQPILVSGPTEPGWPEGDGGFVSDNTISWEAVSRRVEDPKCPNSKIVLIAASKIFAADGDIAPYSSTVNPLNWSEPDDAGYLPTNLQQYGANPISGLGLYRGNMVVMNSQGSQVWQVDEDPAQMALLDAFPVGTSWHDAISPAFNDLFFLTSLGVRTLGIAGGSTNLQAGDAGMPIDPLVQAKMAVENPSMSLYYPAMGQYWLFFGDEAFVYTMNQLGKVGAWTRYVFPFTPTDYTIKGENLYLRAGNIVHRVNPEIESDEQIEGEQTVAVPFEWTVQWPWLDMGQMTVTKMMIGFDIVGYGDARIQFGYDQSSGGLFTPEWEIPADSVPGMLLPMPLAAPSIAVRVTYTGNDETRTGLDALNLWLQDQRATA